jgi:DNA-O6-methylguanine--protein-cysteine S-methyltransferase (EC 2.1.1.63)/Transcriptional regulator Ada
MRNSIADQARHYQQVARAIAYLRQHARSQPSLGELAHHLGMSEFHLQRLFSEWVGVSPKRFLQYLTKQYARQALRSSADILSIALESGLSGSGRLHDLMVTCEAMSPGEIKRGGAGITIQYGTAPTPFGDALMAWTPRGICHIGLYKRLIRPTRSPHSSKTGLRQCLRRIKRMRGNWLAPYSTPRRQTSPCI